jgi:mannose-6-phosphate isomerase-like protein (cupin superfamily)
VAPGGGTPPHDQKTYDERFEVREGELEVMLGKERHTLRPGQWAVAPKNTLHCFKNPTGESTTFLVEMRPGQPGFEKAIKVGYGLAADRRNPLSPLSVGGDPAMVGDPDCRRLERLS